MQRLEWAHFIESAEYFLHCTSSEWTWSSWPSRQEPGRTYLQCEADCLADGESVHFLVHILYSCSYGVPVLYLSGGRPDGSLLRCDELERLFGADCSADDLNKMLSAGEHPVSGRPFFFLHPCRTQELLGSLSLIVSTFVAGWFSWAATPLSALSLPRVLHERASVPVVVSVILPVYNCRPFLAEVVSAVFEQSASCRVQLVAVDDGSSDGSGEELERLFRRWKGWSVLMRRKESRGAGDSRNRCCERAVGKYLCFLDADDVMEAPRIEKQLQAAAERPEYLIGCQMECFPERKPFYEWINSLVLERDLMAFRFREVTVPLPTWFLSRELFWKTGPFLEESRYQPEDLDFFLRFLEQGGRLYKVDSYLLRYRVHEGQSTHRMHRNLLMQHKAAHFSRFALRHWSDGFRIWGNGRDGKKFYQSLSSEAKQLVLCFLEIDAKKHGLKYDGKEIVGIEQAAAPFVCCVAIGKNNGIEEKLARFENGVEYFQLC